MGNDPIFLTNLNLAYVVGRTDRSPCQRTQRWNTSKVCLLAVLITTLSWVVQEKLPEPGPGLNYRPWWFLWPFLGQRIGLDHQENAQENTTESWVWYTFWIKFDIFLGPWGHQIDCFWSSTRQARHWLCQGVLFEAKSLSEGSQKRTQMWLLFGSLFWSLSETSAVGMWGQNGVLKSSQN